VQVCYGMRIVYTFYAETLTGDSLADVREPLHPPS
jgi:hypothetical protein